MGFDKLLFIDPVPLDCVCPICQDVLEDASETISCQHGFCEACILRWLNEHRSCPTCRSPITADDLRPIHRIWREKLISLRMRCENTQHGCTAEITLEELPGHLDICQYAYVPCSHDSCPEAVMRKMLDNHMTTCQFRKTLCEECGLEFLATEIAEHKCVISLREYMIEQIEAAKRETLAECMRMVRKERRHYENLLQEQKRNVEDLRRTLSNLLSHQRMHDKLGTSSSNVHQPRNLPTLARGASATITEEHQTANVRKLSLPRLAPLHTHMNLSRSPADRSRSRSGDIHPR